MTTAPAAAAIELIPVVAGEQVTFVAELAREIWYDYYVPLIGRAQVDYMVPKFQSAEAICRQIEEGYEYFLIQRGLIQRGLIQRGAEVLGYLAVQAQPELKQLFVSKLYVHKNARGAGTGRACMEFIELLAKRRGLGLLWLTVNKRNPAVQAYERLGFRVASPLVIDIGGGFVMDDYRMEKHLG